MSKKQIIATTNAPAAIGTYSQAVRAGNTLWVSGQIPLDPATKELVGGDMEAQVRRVFENLKAIVTAAGASFDDVVKGRSAACCSSTARPSRSVRAANR